MNETDKKSRLNVLIIYFSATGNTEKVANTIWETLKEEKVKVNLLKVQHAAKEELYDYNLVFLGTPTHSFLPAQPVMHFINNKLKLHRERGDIKLCAPKISGKNAVVFCTYSGRHTGINEATPAGKYMGQFFEHIGFEIQADSPEQGGCHNCRGHSQQDAQDQTSGEAGENNAEEGPDQHQSLQGDVEHARQFGKQAPGGGQEKGSHDADGIVEQGEGEALLVHGRDLFRRRRKL